MLSKDWRAVDVDVHGSPTADDVQFSQTRDNVLRHPKIALQAGKHRARMAVDRIETSRPTTADQKIPIGSLLERQMTIGMGNQMRNSWRSSLGHDHLQRRPEHGMSSPSIAPTREAKAPAAFTMRPARSGPREVSMISPDPSRRIDSTSVRSNTRAPAATAPSCTCRVATSGLIFPSIGQYAAPIINGESAGSSFVNLRRQSHDNRCHFRVQLESSPQGSACVLRSRQPSGRP